LVKTAWMVTVLCMDAMPSWFQVRPCWDRSTWTVASSATSPSAARVAVAGKVIGRLASRTVRVPSTVRPSAAGVSLSRVKVIAGYFSAWKKSCERR
jgi:hypothetical protein